MPEAAGFEAILAGACQRAADDDQLLAEIGLFFAKAGAFVFGSGLAIVPFPYGGLVTEPHWLTETAASLKSPR